MKGLDSLSIDISILGTFPDHVIGEEVIADYLLYSLNRQNINTLVIFHYHIKRLVSTWRLFFFFRVERPNHCDIFMLFREN